MLYGGQNEGNYVSTEAIDYLYGGVGDDTIYGGLGSDRIVVGDGGGIDVVADFSGSQGDKIVVKSGINGQAITTAADLIARATNTDDGGVLIDLGGGNSIKLAGVRVADLTTDYFELY